MRLTDLYLKALPFTQEGQRDYADDAVRGPTVRVGKSRKPFMLLIRSGSQRSRVKLGTYPECSLNRAREPARDRLAAARLAPIELPSVTFVEALEGYYRIRGKEQRESTRIRASTYSTDLSRSARLSDSALPNP